MNNCITIGIDLGDKKHAVVGLDDNANVILKRWIPNRAEELEAFFNLNRTAKIGMETGTHCRWISFLAKKCGCDTYVGNAHKLRSIFGNTHKNDMRDAEEIARLLHGDKRHFHPVALRDGTHQELVQLVKMRETVMGQRTRSINSIRGMGKANGVRFPECDADTFHKKLKHLMPTLPANLQKLFAPQVGLLELLFETIKEYERLITTHCDVNFKEDCCLLQTIPGIGPISSASFVAFVGDVNRFKHSRDVGPYFGLTAGRDQSSDKDEPKKITKEGSKFVRKLLVNAANNIMRENVEMTDLKAFGYRIWGNRGKIAKRKSKVALARKLAVTMAAILRSRQPYHGTSQENTGDESTQRPVLIPRDSFEGRAAERVPRC